MPAQFTVPFGRSSLSFAVPDWIEATEVHSQSVTNSPVPDAELVSSAIDRPIGSDILTTLAAGARTAVICVTDATRSCPDHLLVPPMLEALEAAGLKPDAITILVAVGTHRASTEKEKREKLGDAICNRYRVVDHDAFDASGLTDTGVEIDEAWVRLNSIVVESDLVLSTGRVEPHQYAGYSGGGKTVAIGCAAEDVIAYTHGPKMLDRPGTRLGRIDGNPFQDAVREIARAAPVDFVANCVLDDEERLVNVAFGRPEPVQDELVRCASELFTVPIPSQVDVAVAGVGYPKDQNLYQASRAASYLQFAPTQVVRNGGVILLPAPCPEGFGQGVGEQRFGAALAGAGGIPAFLDRIAAGDFQPGEQRAYIMAQVLARVSVIVVGSERPDEIERAGFPVAASMDEAWDMVDRLLERRSSALVVPHALQTLPVVGAA